MSDLPRNHAELKALAKKLRRPLKTLHVLTAGNDPLMVDQDFRVRAANWAAEVYNQLITKPRVHVREIFYKLISQPNPVRENGEPFENTVECFGELSEAVRDARYLGLIPVDGIIDRRNPEPIINPGDESDDADGEVVIFDGSVETTPFGINYEAPRLILPSVETVPPTIGQRYHIEIWIEKSTQNDILLPLGREYGINIATFVGEVSATACKNLIDRALRIGRPVRILHITDFDPAGKISMSVAAAAKIDFYAKKSGHDLDIQLEHVALTPEQCVQYRLPRSPIKESERRAANFEASFGAGAAELDALEALHPGVLRQILIEHIERYYDADLNENVEEAAEQFDTEVEEAKDTVLESWEEELQTLDLHRERITQAFEEVHGPAEAAYNQAVDDAYMIYRQTVEHVREQITAEEQRFVELARSTIARIRDQLKDLPSANSFDWPEPAADEWDDPLYNSTRPYVEQVDRFRRHQGREADVRFRRDRIVTKTCTICGKPFETGIANRTVCSSRCSGKRSQRDRVERLRQARNGRT